MTKILIVGEFSNGKLKGSAAELLAAARAIDPAAEIHGALLGAGSGAAAQGFAAYGVATVHALDGSLPSYSSDGFAAALAPALAGYDYVLLQQSFFGRDLGARLAAATGAAWLSDVTAVEAGPVFVKPLYAGKVISRMRFSAAGLKIVTVRPKVFMPASADASASVSVNSLAESQGYKSKVTSVEAKAEGQIDLKEADIIISGGRGVGGPEGFAPLRDFAGAVGAALGASRAAVDSGWIGHSHQVGQTGKTVNPKLYIACGISGAIQHLAGMQTSGVIVAINNNENAPLMKIADYALVGDLFQIVPELQKQILALRAQG
ncbi:electron transfer flavoprotein subunit alpha/FixB family protein [bacterium]|nr:electron transfer flavoprotein subunit alpha/FixB family protein [bacterium]